MRAANALEKEGSRPECPKTKVTVLGCALAAASTPYLSGHSRSVIEFVELFMKVLARLPRTDIPDIPGYHWPGKPRGVDRRRLGRAEGPGHAHAQVGQQAAYPWI